MEIQFVFHELDWVCRQWSAYFRNMCRTMVVLNSIENVNDRMIKNGTIGIITNEYKARRCVSRSDCGYIEDCDDESTRTLFVLPYVAHAVHSCSNPTSFPILEMPNLLEVSDMLRG